MENAVEFFLLAFRYSRDQLKEAAMKFISENYSQVKETQDWKDLKTDPASGEVLQELVEYMNNE